jgi:membrane protein implicated in regulation of membrane protease activity
MQDGEGETAGRPAHELIGRVGEVVTACRPSGQVRVRGEFWAAICAAGAEPGASVRVTAVDDHLLTVTPRG